MTSDRAWSYIAYMRPRAMPATFVLVATGYALPRVATQQSTAKTLTDLALIFVVYSVLGWGGANALNSSQDKDEGPVNLLPNPPPMPNGLAAFGVVCSLGAVAVSFALGTTAVAVTALMAVLSILYSVRLPGLRWRGKEIGGVDNLINASGCGLLAVVLGAAPTGASLSPRVVLMGVAFTVATFGGYPTTQIFQLEIDASYASARNFTSLLGPARALRASALFFALHVAIVLALLASLSLALTPPRLALIAGWLGLCASAIVYAIRWARDPFNRPYDRMKRQMATMLTGQALLALALWRVVS